MNAFHFVTLSKPDPALPVIINNMHGKEGDDAQTRPVNTGSEDAASSMISAETSIKTAVEVQQEATTRNSAFVQEDTFDETQTLPASRAAKVEPLDSDCGRRTGLSPSSKNNTGQAPKSYRQIILYALFGVSAASALMGYFGRQLLNWTRAYIALNTTAVISRGKLVKSLAAQIMAWARLFCNGPHSNLTKNVTSMVSGDRALITSLKAQLEILEDIKVNSSVFQSCVEAADSAGKEFREILYPPSADQYTSHHSGNPAINALRSEIRSLKGMILSRRNFPLA